MATQDKGRLVRRAGMGIDLALRIARRYYLNAQRQRDGFAWLEDVRSERDLFRSVCWRDASNCPDLVGLNCRETPHVERNCAQVSVAYVFETYQCYPNTTQVCGAGQLPGLVDFVLINGEVDNLVVVGIRSANGRRRLRQDSEGIEGSKVNWVQRKEVAVP